MKWHALSENYIEVLKDPIYSFVEMYYDIHKYF